MDNDFEFAPLTENDYKKIKNLEIDIAKDGRDPKVNQYVHKLIQMEADDEQKEPTTTTEAPQLTQQMPLPWPKHTNAAAKRRSFGKHRRCLRH